MAYEQRTQYHPPSRSHYDHHQRQAPLPAQYGQAYSGYDDQHRGGGDPYANGYTQSDYGHAANADANATYGGGRTGGAVGGGMSANGYSHEQSASHQAGQQWEQYSSTNGQHAQNTQRAHNGYAQDKYAYPHAFATPNSNAKANANANANGFHGNGGPVAEVPATNGRSWREPESHEPRSQSRARRDPPAPAPSMGSTPVAAAVDTTRRGPHAEPTRAKPPPLTSTIPRAIEPLQRSPELTSWDNPFPVFPGATTKKKPTQGAARESSKSSGSGDGRPATAQSKRSHTPSSNHMRQSSESERSHQEPRNHHYESGGRSQYPHFTSPSELGFEDRRGPEQLDDRFTPPASAEYRDHAYPLEDLRRPTPGHDERRQEPSYPQRTFSPPQQPPQQVMRSASDDYVSQRPQVDPRQPTVRPGVPPQRSSPTEWENPNVRHHLPPRPATSNTSRPAWPDRSQSSDESRPSGHQRREPAPRPAELPLRQPQRSNTYDAPPQRSHTYDPTLAPSNHYDPPQPSPNLAPPSTGYDPFGPPPRSPEEMPNFDAIPMHPPNRRRGSSFEEHLPPAGRDGPPLPLQPPATGPASASGSKYTAYNGGAHANGQTNGYGRPAGGFSAQAHRSRSQPDLRGQSAAQEARRFPAEHEIGQAVSPMTDEAMVIPPLPSSGPRARTPGPGPGLAGYQPTINSDTYPPPRQRRQQTQPQPPTQNFHQGQGQGHFPPFAQNQYPSHPSPQLQAHHPPLQPATPPMGRPGVERIQSPSNVREQGPSYGRGPPPAQDPYYAGRRGPNAGFGGPTASPGPGIMPTNGAPAPATRSSNPDALPAHPAPVRPGLMPGSMANQAIKAPPVRQYANSGPPSQSSVSSPQSPEQVTARRRRSDPVTREELERLSQAVKANPSDQKTQLKLAKKYVEAATVLADEGGRADAKTKSRNRERYTFDAHKLLKKLVSAGNADAMFYLADCHGSGGLGLQPDPKEAFNLYQAAAKAGHGQAAYRTAVCCELGLEDGGGTKKDPLKAMHWYKRSASMGDTPAMYKMGMILLKGLLGQPANPREAITWLKRAAERADEDNPHALHELGLLYEKASGRDNIPQDEAYSRQLFTQAANLGYKFSQYRLGCAYEYGLMGCPIDPRQSIAWYSRAAVQEEHQSELALSGWYLTGSEGVLQQSDTEAYLWARKAAMAGLAKAEYAMGYFTEVGIGAPANAEDAKRWYWRAAGKENVRLSESWEWD
ncbi:MAG: hypothetical protein M1838_005031 [Thelocarpon superellum]|nr:MAG: hypothetical protein M1838_005031 [Thelocarpon superellum]